MQGPEEEESEGGGGVGKGRVIHCPGDQAHQQAHDHTNVPGCRILWVQTEAFETHLYIEKARKSHLARVVLMDITVVVTYSVIIEHNKEMENDGGERLPRWQGFPI